MKIETQTEALKIQGAYLETYETSSSEDLGEHEERVEEHAHVSYEEQQHITDTSLTQIDIFDRLQKPHEPGQLAISRDETSSDLSKTRDTRSIKRQINTKTEAVMDKCEAKKQAVTVSDKQIADKSLLDEGVFVRQVELMTKAIIDERKDITLIANLDQVPKPFPTERDVHQVTQKEGFRIPTETKITPKPPQTVDIRVDTAHGRIRQELINIKDEKIQLEKVTAQQKSVDKTEVEQIIVRDAVTKVSEMQGMTVVERGPSEEYIKKGKLLDVLISTSQRTGSAEVNVETDLVDTSTVTSPMKTRTTGDTVKKTLITQELVADTHPKATGTELGVVMAQMVQEDEVTFTTKGKSKMENLVESTGFESQGDEVSLQILPQAEAQLFKGTVETKPLTSNAEERKEIFATEVSSRGTKNIPFPSYLHPHTSPTIYLFMIFRYHLLFVFHFLNPLFWD